MLIIIIMDYYFLLGILNNHIKGEVALNKKEQPRFL